MKEIERLNAENAAKEAARAAKKLAEERQAQEAELQRWSTELRAEVDSAIQRLTAQREEQISKCTHFERVLEANIEQMQAMQLQVRRRAAALETAFDASVQRLSSAYTEAVHARRAQALGDLEQQHDLQQPQRHVIRPPQPPLPQPPLPQPPLPQPIHTRVQ